jgi:hypothetical protein
MDRPVPLRPDPRELSRSEQRSLIRAITAAAVFRDGNAAAKLKAAWPNDAGAALVLRAATRPLETGDFPQVTTVGVLPTLAPESAEALRSS